MNDCWAESVKQAEKRKKKFKLKDIFGSIFFFETMQPVPKGDEGYVLECTNTT